MLSPKQIAVILLIIGAVIGVLGIVLYDNGSKDRDRLIDSTKGTISNPSMNKSFVPSSNQDYAITVGAITAVFPYSELSEGINLRRVINIDGADYDIKITFDSNYNMQVSTDIKNDKGDTIAYISNNEWGAEPDSLLIKDRNFNSYAFEVVSKNNLPILQVLLVNQTHIKIGLCINASNTWLFMPINHVTEIITQPKYSDFDYAINSKLFVYPSTTNLGTLVDPDAYSNPPNWNDSTSAVNSTPITYPQSDPLSPSTWKIIIGGMLQVVGLILGGLFAALTVQNARKTKKHKSKDSTRQSITKKNIV